MILIHLNISYAAITKNKGIKGSHSIIHNHIYLVKLQYYQKDPKSPQSIF